MTRLKPSDSIWIGVGRCVNVPQYEPCSIQSHLQNGTADSLHKSGSTIRTKPSLH